MNTSEQEHFNFLYQQHLALQDMRPATIDTYSRAMRSITFFFDRLPDTLTKADLKHYFAQLIQTHSWSTIKLDRNGLQLLQIHTERQWEWINIVYRPVVFVHVVSMQCNLRVVFD